MNNEDIILVNRLIKLGHIILNIYKDLSKLDINSLEYQNLLTKLNSYKDLEDDIYLKFKNNPSKLYDLEEYIRTISESTILTDYELLTDGTPFELVKKHIYNKLSLLRKESQTLTYQKTYNGPEAFVPFDSKFYLKTSIHEDFIKLFIFKLQELINNPNSYLYQDKLKEIINLTLFLYPKNITLDNDYLILNSNSLATILGVSKYYKKYIHKYFLVNIKPSLIAFLTTRDSDYQNSHDVLRNLVNISLIKSYLEFKNLEIIDIKTQIHDIMKLYKNNQKSITILEDLLKEELNSKVIITELRGIYEYEDSKTQGL